MAPCVCVAWSTCYVIPPRSCMNATCQQKRTRKRAQPARPNAAEYAVTHAGGDRGPTCNGGLSATSDQPPRCSLTGTRAPCSGSACPSMADKPVALQPPASLPDMCTLGAEGEACCTQVADTNGCKGGLACEEGTCVLCGTPGKEPCFACPRALCRNLRLLPLVNMSSASTSAFCRALLAGVAQTDGTGLPGAT